MPDQHEKRYAKRVDADECLATVWSGSEEIRGIVLNVSTGGIALLTSPGVSLARFVRLRAALGEGWPNVDLDAIVLRRERRGQRVLWGMEFYQAPHHVLKQVESFVRERGGQKAAAGTEDQASEAGDETHEPRTSDLIPAFTTDSHLKQLYTAAIRSVDH